jgi:hypothetical protein
MLQTKVYLTIVIYDHKTLIVEATALEKGEKGGFNMGG